jgi:8-oxo-dGTP diphosphatase
MAHEPIEHIVDCVLIKDKSILMVQQRKPIAYGLWGFPGGHVEPGETVILAVRRELHEELGITAPLDLRLLSTYSMGENLLARTFTASYPGPIQLDTGELMDYKWLISHEIRALGPDLRSPWILPVLDLLKN